MTNVLFPSGPRTRGNARPTSWEASHLTQPLVQMKQADIGPFSFTPTAGAPDLSINELKTHLSHSDHWANSSVPTTSSCSHTVCPQGDQIAPAGTGKWCLGRSWVWKSSRPRATVALEPQAGRDTQAKRQPYRHTKHHHGTLV